MKTVFLALPLLLPSCVDLGESKLTLDVQSERLVADGESGTPIEICNESAEPADVTATLRASAGSWEGAPDSEPQSIELFLTRDANCGSATWLAPSKLGRVHFEVEVAGVVRARETRSLLEAQVSKVEIKGGLLNQDQVTTLELTADFTTTSGGSATYGTIVDLSLESVPSGMAYLSYDSIIVGKRDTVTLYAPAGTESVRVTASIAGSADATTCQLLTTSTIQTCP